MLNLLGISSTQTQKDWSEISGQKVVVVRDGGVQLGSIQPKVSGICVSDLCDAWACEPTRPLGLSVLFHPLLLHLDQGEKSLEDYSFVWLLPNGKQERIGMMIFSSVREIIRTSVIFTASRETIFPTSLDVDVVSINVCQNNFKLVTFDEEDDVLLSLSLNGDKGSSAQAEWDPSGRSYVLEIHFHTFFTQWDPGGGGYIASCISWPLYFKQWDPGKCSSP